MQEDHLWGLLTAACTLEKHRQPWHVAPPQGHHGAQHIPYSICLWWWWRTFCMLQNIHLTAFWPHKPMISETYRLDTNQSMGFAGISRVIECVSSKQGVSRLAVASGWINPRVERSMTHLCAAPALQTGLNDSKMCRDLTLSSCQALWITTIFHLCSWPQFLLVSNHQSNYKPPLYHPAIHPADGVLPYTKPQWPIPAFTSPPNSTCFSPQKCVALFLVFSSKQFMRKPHRAKSTGN